MNPKTKNKVKKKKSVKKQPPQKRVLPSILEVFPLRKIAKDEGFLMGGGTYMNIYYIFPRDYYNMSETNVCLDIFAFDKYYCTMREAIKFVCFSSNLDTTANQTYYYNLYVNSKNPIKRRVLREEIEILKTLEGREQKESFLFVYADNYERMVEINRHIQKDFCVQGLARQMTLSEKEAVFKRLNNPFSHPSNLRRA